MEKHFVTVGFMGGTNLSDALLRMKFHAKIDDCVYKTRFNGVELEVDKSTDLDMLEKHYDKMLKLLSTFDM